MAEVVLKLAAMDEPPVRLVTGTDAYMYATAAAKARAESDERWRELSARTDHDEATSDQLDPLGNRAAQVNGGN